MPQIARKTDTCDHGGAPIDIEGEGINSTVTVNGLPIAIQGDGTGSISNCNVWQEGTNTSPGDDTHPLGRDPNRDGAGVPGPTGGSPTVFVAGIPVHRFNDPRGCGAETITSSPDVWADAIPQIRIQGATVDFPKASPAAPTALSFPYPVIFAFTGLAPKEGVTIDPCNCPPATSGCGGWFDTLIGDCGDGDSFWDDWWNGHTGDTSYNKPDFYVPTKNSLTKSFQSLEWGDFYSVGPSLSFTVDFPDDMGDFDVPDIDRASRGNIPSVCTNNKSQSICGLFLQGFPSYGLVKDLSISITDSTQLVDTFYSDYGGFDKDCDTDSANYGLCSNWLWGGAWGSWWCTALGMCDAGDQLHTLTSGGYEFKVENESGSVSTYVHIVIMPAPPGSLCNFTGCLE